MSFIIIFIIEVLYYTAIIIGGVLLIACIWLLIGYLLDKYR